MSQLVVGERERHPLALNEPLPLTRHPAMVYLRGLARGSRSTMAQSLNAIASLLTGGSCDHLSLNWGALRYEQTSAVQAALLDRYESTTAKKMICALRRVLTEARKLGQIGSEDYAGAIDLPGIKAHNSLRGRALSQGEIRRLMEICGEDATCQGTRDAALIAMLRGAGLRRAEVVSLKLGDFTPETGALAVRNGKGGKERTVYLPPGAIELVSDWLCARGRKPGPLLCPIRKGGTIQYRHLSAQAVLLIVQKRAAQAGVEAFSPHDFRRTFCSDLLDAGVDIVTVQKLAGHASPLTTAKYDRRGEETKRQAVQNLEL